MTVSRTVEVGELGLANDRPLVVIAGPCQLESLDHALAIAETLAAACAGAGAGLIFKGSYDKANRTSAAGFRGPGIEEGLKILEKVKRTFDLPVLSDIHSIEQVDPAAEVLDVLQIPAFLCRQTDLLTKAAASGKPVNIKKGQFLAPWDMRNVVGKMVAAGNESIILTERGASFGYNNLVVDMRSFPVMRSFGYPVVFDATHSVQIPGGQGTSSGGQREFEETLSRAAVATGIDGIFMEVHESPDQALCDGPNSIPLNELPDLLKRLIAIDEVIR